VLIGVFLIVDGFGVHVDKALIYLPMAFAVGVEALNLAYRARQRKLRSRVPDDA
jgi:predicted tellurium resistance membrane protein TerC